MPKGHPNVHICRLCNETILGNPTFFNHLIKVHDIQPTIYRWKYLEGNLDSLPYCCECGQVITYKSHPFRDSLEYCRDCHTLVRAFNGIDTKRKMGTLKGNDGMNLREGSRDADFMYAKMASRVDVSKPCILYVTRDEEKVKVGFSFNFGNRYKNLPPIVLRKVEFLDSYNCIKAECNIHNDLKDIALIINDKKSEYYPISHLDNILKIFDFHSSQLLEG